MAEKKQEKKDRLSKEEKREHFRVTIFGSARIQKNDKIYKDVSALAEEIGKHNFDIITGGGPGLMQAANEGHQKGKKSGKAHSIGITIELPFESKANKYLDIRKHFERFSDRLDEFMILSNVAVVMPGGIGTCLELFYSWQLTQVKHICNMPIILVGDMWAELIEWAKGTMLKEGRMSPEDLNNIFVVKDNEEAMKIILKANDVYIKEGENYCLNFKKYKLD